MSLVTRCITPIHHRGHPNDECSPTTGRHPHGRSARDSLTACATSDRDDDGGGAAGGTMVFSAAGAPKNFDPIFNDDGESFRPAHQMFDTLITYKAGTSELEPGLATSWTSTPDGKKWTFDLRQGVTFHDGIAFDAGAVCANFDRWFNMKGAAAQSQMIYFGDVFEGFAKNEGDSSGSPIYKNCQAKGREYRGAEPEQVHGRVPGGVRPDLVFDLEPDGAEAVQRGRGDPERGLVHLPGLRQRAPDRHRAVQIRELQQGQPDHHPGPQRGVLGREGQARQADLQDHPG
ncbi:MAG: ABC transporter substrate-binding protein [Pseudonocardia sp.]|nr:ABC transporter substrate-binding protein [Pseudonocardia sp.]